MLERIHKLSAALVFAFLCLHFANHFVGLFGVDAHSQVMDALRILYRYPAVEWAVFAAFTVQIATGAPLILEIWVKKKDFVHQLMAVSGLIMVLFILGHVGFIVVAREVWHLDTGFAFVTASLTSPVWRGFFYAFYGAGVFSLFLHFACVAYGVFKKSNKAVAWLCLVAAAGLGGYVTWLLLMMYGAKLYPVAIPEAYAKVFGSLSMNF